MGKRHKFVQKYSLDKVDGFDWVPVDITNWTDKTAEGLAQFIKITIPNWEHLAITKDIIVIDPQKKDGDNIVSKKRSVLQIARVNSGTVQSVKVDADLTKNGKIPQNISTFFKAKQK